MRPHTKAGYMTAPDYDSLTAKCPCREGPSIHDPKASEAVLVDVFLEAHPEAPK